MICLENVKGQRVLNTRPKEQAEKMKQIIEAAGGVSIDVPLLHIDRLAPSTWLELLPSLSTCDYAIFTSHHAVTFFLDGLEQQNLTILPSTTDKCEQLQQKISWPTTLKIIAIGEATQHTLIQRGLHVHHLPTQANSEYLLTLPALQHIQNKSILLIKGENGRTLISETLTARGATLKIIKVYRRTLPQEQQQTLIRLWQTDGIDRIVFTSQEAMENLFILLPPAAHPWIQSKPCYVISERLANAAKTKGMKSVLIN